MNMIAEATAAPAGLAAWLACAAFVLMLVNQGFKLKRNLVGDPADPPNSSLNIQVQTVARDVERIDGDVKRVDGDVKKLRQDIVTNGETRRVAIEGKVEAVAKENRAQCLSIHTRLDEMPARIIELLRNAGRIK